VLAPAAAGTVLDLDDVFHQLVRFCFFLLREVFAFSQAAVRCLTVASALVPMAQIKPRSSRPTAVTIFLLSLPVAASLAYRLCSRCCAFHAISLASSDTLCWRFRNPAQMAGGRW
jgi:hypothetical protein